MTNRSLPNSKNHSTDVRVLGIIQARLTSTRLPNKVLHEINGKPLIVHMYQRLLKARRLDEIVVAIPDNKANEPLEERLQQEGIPSYVGSESDVLDRFYQSAHSRDSKPNVVVRFTGDCPLIDPKHVDDMIDRFMEKPQTDYIRTGKSFADGQGVEIISMHALEQAHQHAEEPRDREHVTTYIKFYPEQFVAETMETQPNQQHLRYTVDTPEDMKVVEAIFQEEKRRGKLLSTLDIKEFLEAHPDITRLNQQYARNHLDGKL